MLLSLGKNSPGLTYLRCYKSLIKGLNFFENFFFGIDRTNKFLLFKKAIQKLTFWPQVVVDSADRRPNPLVLSFVLLRHDLDSEVVDSQNEHIALKLRVIQNLTLSKFQKTTPKQYDSKFSSRENSFRFFSRFHNLSSNKSPGRKSALAHSNL